MKVRDVIADARVLLNDKDANRWSNDDLIPLVAQAQRLLGSHRPDALVNSSGNLNNINSDPERDSADLVTPDKFKTTMVAYVLGQAFLRQDSSESASRADRFMRQFYADLQTI